MLRHRLVWLTLFCLALLSGGTASARAAAPPNILFILSDDQSYKTIGCYPESWPWVKTPNIDRLAASGVRFQAGYLGSWCMPSRSTLLTGRLPHGIESMRMAGVYPASAYDPKQCRFWPSVLREAGYTTAQIGKWHTGIDAGWGRDWDHQMVWNRPKHPENAGAYYEKQILAVDGYPCDNYTKWGVDYIRGAHRAPGKPWYLWLCYGSIHGPCKPAERHKGRYADAPVPPPADLFGPRPGKPAYLDATQAWKREADGTPIGTPSGEDFGDESGSKRFTHTDFVRQVNECVPALDEGVGQLIAALEATGQLTNTLVVYVADQGFGMGEHGFRTKLAPYDATYRSPLIVSFPGVIPKGGYCPQSVNGADLVATIAQFAKLTIPWSTHGRDLMPLLKNPNASWPYPCLYEHLGEHYGSDVFKVMNTNPAEAEYHKVPWYVAVVQERWKLIHYLKPGVGDELYDLQTDPEELTNAIAQPTNMERLTRLQASLTSELRRTGAGGLVPKDFGH